jgi:hypothetical protein
MLEREIKPIEIWQLPFSKSIIAFNSNKRKLILISTLVEIRLLILMKLIKIQVVLP